MSDGLESRILRAATATESSELPEFPDNKSDLPSDYEYNPEDFEEEEVVEDIDENDLLKYLDEQENPLYIAQRLFYTEVNTTDSQARSPSWHLECLSAKAIEDLYGHGWTTIDGLVDLSAAKGAHEEAQKLSQEGAFARASNYARSDDPFRDHTARDDWITWLDPSQPSNPKHLQTILDFFNGPLHRDLSKMIRLQGKTEYQLALYRPENGAQYERHRDSFPTDDPEDTHQRRVTAIMYLNPGWIHGDGGELKIFGQAEPHGMTDAADRTVEPMLGRLVVFLSGVVDHAVLPSNKERFALTAWMR